MFRDLGTPPRYARSRGHLQFWPREFAELQSIIVLTRPRLPSPAVSLNLYRSPVWVLPVEVGSGVRALKISWTVSFISSRKAPEFSPRAPEFSPCGAGVSSEDCERRGGDDIVL